MDLWRYSLQQGEKESAGRLHGENPLSSKGLRPNFSAPKFHPVDDPEIPNKQPPCGCKKPCKSWDFNEFRRISSIYPECYN